MYVYFVLRYNANIRVIDFVGYILRKSCGRVNNSVELFYSFLSLIHGMLCNALQEAKPSVALATCKGLDIAVSDYKHERMNKSRACAKSSANASTSLKLLFCCSLFYTDLKETNVWYYLYISTGVNKLCLRLKRRMSPWFMSHYI